jgi:type II secretory pathway pseudopilin PulG
MKTRREGFSIIELVLVVGLIGLIATVSGLSLVRRKGTTELDSMTRQIVAALREAQSRSMSQNMSTTWGVYFSNSTSSPFVSLYHGTYSTTTRVNYYRIPSAVRFVTSSLAVGATTTVTFSQISGLASASTTIRLQLVNEPNTSATIRIASSGAISF